MILVDTDVLIAHLRGVEAAGSWMRETRSAGRRLAVSVLTTTELLGGMRSPERREVAQLVSSLRALPVTEPIARRAGELRRHYRRSHSTIGTVDYVIAATAQRHGAELATLNVKHFPMFDGLRPPFTV